MTKDTKNKEKEFGLSFMLEYAIDLARADEILMKEIVGIGEGAHINIPKKHLGKKAKVIIYRKEEDNSKK